MNKVVVVILCALLLAITTARECNVYDYGAKGDGKTMDTVPIKKAIADCSNGNGNVLLFPAGNFLTAPFNLTSNLNVEITPGATLLASQNPSLAYNSSSSKLLCFTRYWPTCTLSILFICYKCY